MRKEILSHILDPQFFLCLRTCKYSQNPSLHSKCNERLQNCSKLYKCVVSRTLLYKNAVSLTYSFKWKTKTVWGQGDVSIGFFFVKGFSPLNIARKFFQSTDINIHIYLYIEYSCLLGFDDVIYINPLKPNDPYRGRTAPLTSKRCILYIYSTNTGTEYFIHGIHSTFFLMQFVS